MAAALQEQFDSVFSCHEENSSMDSVTGGQLSVAM